MNAPVKALVAALLIGSPLFALAVDEHHPEQAPAAPTDTAPAQDQAMTEQMQKMQAIHDRIAAAKTPAERQAAMQEGMQAMREGMAMLQNNCPGMGMGMGMSGGKGGGMGGGMGMMNMMMKMMDQQSDMMKQPTNP